MTELAEKIIRETQAALACDERIDLHEFPVELSHRDDRLVISGLARDIVQKRLTVNYLRQVADGRLSVEDQLRVSTEDTGDRELRDALARSFRGETIFRQTTLAFDAEADGFISQFTDNPQDKIDVTVGQGVVTLSGNVSSLAHKRMAEVLAWWTPGTADVENNLEVTPPEEDNDEEITEAVQMVLEKDPLIDADHLRPGTAAGVVMLSGAVLSNEERQLALSDAWCVPGVWEVVDRTELAGNAPTHRAGVGASDRRHV